jgi:hypothetical protein
MREKTEFGEGGSEQVNSYSLLATKTIMFCRGAEKLFTCSLWRVFSGFRVFFGYFDVKSTV